MKKDQSYIRGQQQATAALNAWKQLGFASPEACRVHQLALTQDELGQAKVRGDARHIAFFEGWLSILAR